ncbi:3-deoxy-7-phosphoheptulonate synthase [Christensenella sp. MSJ-20]|uniref:3-deoxy-7-phosphoheptulonate synthase n=1 Tax=Christensenella sp. MSJ-20 TaxID=2841518 RepID=UPI000D7A7FFF|nr:MAG: 3-deoxy-7-phosphoheptulonate synthase [Bacillota bacterium]QWT55997.1 3-deoxy-7-phosphoheptulonate synthase [Christensenella sp. MSJ-20]
MIVVLKQGTQQKEIDKLTDQLSAQGVEVNPVVGKELIILGLVGDTSKIDPSRIEANRNVERVMHVAEPFKKANRSFHPENTVVTVGDRTIGDVKLALIAGPCSVESEEQIVSVAKSVKESGAGFLRGGAFKPRTSPYAFQGLKYQGLELLKEARAITGLPIVSELMSPDDIDVFVRDVDVIQVGARNMQNFDLLKQLGKIHKPILLKRGLCATYEEWLMSAEYIMAGGNENVILCERGIRTYETYTRNTTDLGAVPAIKRLSHLPILVDPSHATGKWWMVSPLAKAAIAVGADGLMIEVHNDPAHALCDGQQSIKPCVLDELVKELRVIAQAVGREL